MFIHDTNITFLLFTQKKRNVIRDISENIIPYLEVTYCFSGEMHYYCNGEHIELHDGDAIIVPAGNTGADLLCKR